MTSVEEKDLQTLFLQRKKYIKKRNFPIDTLLSDLVFIISALLSDFQLKGTIIKVGVWALIIIYTIYFIIGLIDFIVNSYTVNDMYNDIVQISKKQHNFSLLVIKDTSGIHKESFLLRYDKRWKCYLLPYRRTQEDDKENTKDYCTNSLLFEDCFVGACKTDTVTKMSESANRMKTYIHTFYPVSFSLKASRNISKNRKINILGEKYKWFTIDEMKNNKRIMSCNGETVDFIEKNYI